MTVHPAGHDAGREAGYLGDSGCTADSGPSRWSARCASGRARRARRSPAAGLFHRASSQMFLQMQKKTTHKWKKTLEWISEKDSFLWCEALPVSESTPTGTAAACCLSIPLICSRLNFKDFLFLLQEVFVSLGLQENPQQRPTSLADCHAYLCHQFMHAMNKTTWVSCVSTIFFSERCTHNIKACGEIKRSNLDQLVWGGGGAAWFRLWHDGWKPNKHSVTLQNKKNNFEIKNDILILKFGKILKSEHKSNMKIGFHLIKRKLAA